MLRDIFRWILTVAALYLINMYVPGISAQGVTLWQFIALGAIFVIVNALIRPLMFSTGFLILIIITLIANLLIFYATRSVAGYFGITFYIANVNAALYGSIVISVLNLAFSLAVRDKPAGSYK